MTKTTIKTTAIAVKQPSEAVIAGLFASMPADKRVTELRTRIKTIGKTVASLADMIHQAGLGGLVHAQNTGDVTLLTELVNSLGKQHRAKAVKAWLENYAPLVWVKGQYVVAKKKDAKPYDIVGAEFNPFWDFTEEADPILYTTDDFLKQAKSLLTRMENAISNGEVVEGEEENISAFAEMMKNTIGFAQAEVLQDVAA